ERPSRPKVAASSVEAHDLGQTLFRRGCAMNDQWRSRITIESGKRGGRPCIRGMRITVYDVLSSLAAWDDG
ncbi:MAG TPA: DUF433 domain-containing protein, partial [Planctomycetaceae bacterium]|nr:DUF433 domain-containing protein [Planctomycetaceae bacterium]